jgi:hypothetical protein
VSVSYGHVQRHRAAGVGGSGLWASSATLSYQKQVTQQHAIGVHCSNQVAADAVLPPTVKHAGGGVMAVYDWV